MSSGAGHRRSFFARRLSTASLLTLSSIHTVLPKYSVDNDGKSIDPPPAFEESDQPSSNLADQDGGMIAVLHVETWPQTY